MKLHIFVIIVITLIKVNFAFDENLVIDSFRYKDFNFDLSSISISEKCNSSEKKCLWKCCPKGQIMGIFKTCIPSAITVTNVTVYDFAFKPTNKSLESIFELVPGALSDEIFAQNVLWWHKGYLKEDGTLFLKFPNVWNRWKNIDINHFCVDMRNETTIQPIFMAEYSILHTRKPNEYNMLALAISTVFLMLTLLAYVVIPQLRNMNGIILMVYLCCLIVSFIIYAVLESYGKMKITMSEIINLTFFYYFFKVCSFCWTNVIFYRILMSRSETKDIPVLKLLLKYSLYAVGVALFLTFMVATLELGDLTDTPWFITPQIRNKGNFVFHEIESVYHLYVPLMLILAFNWIVCFIKVIEFCKTKRFSVVAVDEEARAQEKVLNRPIQFVKLLATVSCHCFVETITVMFPKGSEYASIAFTLCIGAIIMVIFIFDQNVRPLLTEQASLLRTRAANLLNKK